MARRSFARMWVNGSPLDARVAQWGFRGLVQSVQAGTITITAGNTTATATITAVDPTRSTITYGGMTQAQHNTNWGVGLGRVTLTNATTVSGFIDATADNAVLAYVVVQYQAGVLRSVQRGTIAWATAGNATATITAVVAAKTDVVYLGQTMTSTSAPQTDEGAARVVLANATTVTATKIAAGGITVTLGFEAREYY